MAISRTNCGGFRGTIDKKIVVRQLWDGRTVLSTYPDMTRIKPSEDQKKQRALFAEAQKAAMEFLADPAKREIYKSRCKPGQRAHGLFIAEWIKEHKEIKPEPEKLPYQMAESRFGTGKGHGRTKLGIPSIKKPIRRTWYQDGTYYVACNGVIMTIRGVSDVPDTPSGTKVKPEGSGNSPNSVARLGSAC